MNLLVNISINVSLTDQIIRSKFTTSAGQERSEGEEGGGDIDFFLPRMFTVDARCLSQLSHHDAL